MLLLPLPHLLLIQATNSAATHAPTSPRCLLLHLLLRRRWPAPAHVGQVRRICTRCLPPSRPGTTTYTSCSTPPLLLLHAPSCSPPSRSWTTTCNTEHIKEATSDDDDPRLMPILSKIRRCGYKGFGSTRKITKIGQLVSSVPLEAHSVSSMRGCLSS